MVNEFTVVLRRPDWMGSETSTVVEHVSVDGVMLADARHEAAAQAGREAACRADQTADYCEDRTPDDYALLVLFPGKIYPLMFGD